MLFLLSILFSLLSNTFDLSTHAPEVNSNEHFGVFSFSKKTLNNQPAFINIKLYRFGIIKRAIQSKYPKRSITKRCLAISSCSGIDLNNPFSYIVQNNNVHICFLSFYLHPNSLRAPPIIYCI